MRPMICVLGRNDIYPLGRALLFHDKMELAFDCGAEEGTMHGCETSNIDSPEATSYLASLSAALSEKWTSWSCRIRCRRMPVESCQICTMPHGKAPMTIRKPDGEVAVYAHDRIARSILLLRDANGDETGSVIVNGKHRRVRYSDSGRPSCGFLRQV